MSIRYRLHLLHANAVTPLSSTQLALTSCVCWSQQPRTAQCFVSSQNSRVTHFNDGIELSQNFVMIEAELSTANMGRPQIHALHGQWLGGLIAASDLLVFGIQGKVNYGISYCSKWLQCPQSSTQTSFDLGTASLLCSGCIDSSFLSLQPHTTKRSCCTAVMWLLRE